jgi:hypothetical protein
VGETQNDVFERLYTEHDQALFEGRVYHALRKLREAMD